MMPKAWPVCLVALSFAAVAPAGDYPQWRGPLGCGAVPDSPPLAAAWGEQGPPLLWQAGDFPGGGEGGYGSVAVASGRAYVFANEKYKVPLTTRTLREERLRDLGWHDVKLPEALAKAVEAARTSPQREDLDHDQRREWVKKWLDDHLKTEDEKKQYARFVADRLNRGRQALPLEVLDRLATIRDKELPGAEALEKWLADSAIDGEDKKAVLRAVPTYVERSWDTVYCFAVADGSPCWQARFDGAAGGRSASSTPCVAEGRCYVAGSDGVIYCLDAQDGKEVWKARPEAKGGTVHSSPVVMDGVVVVLAGRLTGLDAGKGTVLWRQEKVGGQENSPVAWRAGGKAMAICNTGRDVACVDVRTGEVRWAVRGGGRSTAAVSGEHMAVFTGRKEHGLLGYRISADKAEQIWAVPQCADGGASPAIADGQVYLVCRDLAVCVELATGKVAWEQKLSARGYSSPGVADGKLLALVGRGAYLIRAHQAGYELLAKANLAVVDHSSPAVTGGRLYLRMKKGIACFDLAARPAQSNSTPAVDLPK